MVLQRVRKQKPTYSLYVPPIVSPQRAVGHFYSWCRAVISHVSVSHSHMCFLEGKFLLKCGQSGGLARIIAANFPLKFWIWSKYEEKSHSWPFELCKKKKSFWLRLWVQQSFADKDKHLRVYSIYMWKDHDMPRDDVSSWSWSGVWFCFCLFIQS
jgi:hypothetical protein